MIETKFIEELARKYQTSKDNVAREYCQHLFLSKFYQQEQAEEILFKGGTALRILWQSPRFSEDLDFSSRETTFASMENKIETALLSVEREGHQVHIVESKKTSGGYLAQVNFDFSGFSVPIKIEVSQRKKLYAKQYEQTLVSNDLTPAYTILHLLEKELIQEKIDCLLSRAKPRDYFDLYFILRRRLSFQEVFARHKTIPQRILEQLSKTKINFSLELKQFLPLNLHSLLKDFPSILKRELKASFPSSTV